MYMQETKNTYGKDLLLTAVYRWEAVCVFYKGLFHVQISYLYERDIENMYMEKIYCWQPFADERQCVSLAKASFIYRFHTYMKET